MRTLRCPTGYCRLFSRPKAMIDVMLRSAGESKTCQTSSYHRAMSDVAREGQPCDHSVELQPDSVRDD
jgi:hypothetical protein